LNVIIYTIALSRLGISKWKLVLIISSPFVFYSILYGNIDSLVLLGATLSPFWGIWLLLCKPQMSIGLILFWIYQSLQKGHKTLIKDFGLISLLYLLFWVIGLHPRGNPTQEIWNIRTFPWGLIPGIILLWRSKKDSNKNLALSSSPYLSPYAAMQSWIVVILPSLQSSFFLWIGYILGWVIVLLRFLLKAEAFKFEPLLFIIWGFLLIGHISRKHSN